MAGALIAGDPTADVRPDERRVKAVDEGSLVGVEGRIEKSDNALGVGAIDDVSSVGSSDGDGVSDSSSLTALLDAAAEADGVTKRREKSPDR